MSPDELYKLSPYLLKKYPEPADLEKAIYNKFNKNLIDLTVDDLNKARGTAVGTKIKVPTIMGGVGEVDLGNMGRTFLEGVTFGFGDNLEASLTGNDINVIRERAEQCKVNFKYNSVISWNLPLLNNSPNKPKIVPENIAIPSLLINNSSKSSWGSDNWLLLRNDIDDSSIILL